MLLERIESNCTVIYKRNGEVVGVIRYNQATPSNSALEVIAKRILLVYRHSLMTESNE